jgi:hypothetical protein
VAQRIDEPRLERRVERLLIRVANTWFVTRLFEPHANHRSPITNQ